MIKPMRQTERLKCTQNRGEKIKSHSSLWLLHENFINILFWDKKVKKLIILETLLKKPALINYYIQCNNTLWSIKHKYNSVHNKVKFLRTSWDFFVRNCTW